MKRVVIMWLALAGVLAALACTALAADNVGPQQPKKKPAPSFKPGAEVTLSLSFNAPEDFAFNEMLPLTVKFDKDTLKKAAYTVEKDTWEFQLKPHVGRTTVNIPIKLKKDAAEGQLLIPLEASCIVCTLDGEQCQPVNEGLTVKVTVRASAPAGEENQAQAKGALPWQHTFSAR
jgi:hypothetical protein